MLAPNDRIHIEVVMDSIKVALSHHIDRLFDERKESFASLMNSAIENYPWEAKIKAAIDKELDAHAATFVSNAIGSRVTSRNWDAYRQIQRDVTALAKTRLQELALDSISKEGDDE